MRLRWGYGFIEWILVNISKMEGFFVSSLVKGIVWRSKYECMKIRSFDRKWNEEKKFSINESKSF